MNQKHFYWLSILLVFLLLPGCGGSSEPQTTVAPAEVNSQAQGAAENNDQSVPEEAPPPTTAPEPTTIPEPTPAPTDTAVPEDTPMAEPQPTASNDFKLSAETTPLEAITRSQMANFSASSVRTTTTVTNQDTGELTNTIVGEILPGQGLMRVTTDFSEMIIADGVTYSNFDSQWRVLDVDMSGMLGNTISPDPAQNSESLDELMQAMGLHLGEVQLIGPETLDGRDTLVYAYSESMGDVTAETRVWIGVDDNRTYRTESTSDLDGQTLLTEVTYEYDIPLTIEVPQVEGE